MQRLSLVPGRFSTLTLTLLLAACGGESAPTPSQTGTGGTSTSTGGTSSGGSGATSGYAGIGASGGTDAGGGSAGGTSIGGAAGAGGECPGNPSGYMCDAWSVHLYPSNGVRRDASQLRFEIRHDPDLEGYPEDLVIAPGHEFSQVMTVTVELTPQVRDYLCTVLVPATPTEPIDPSLPSFSSIVSPYAGATLQAGLPNDYIAHPENVVDICGAGPLTPVVNPSLVAMPTLPDIVLVLPLEPEPTGFQPGQTFSAWLARGIMWVDEESELSPTVTVTIVDFP